MPRVNPVVSGLRSAAIALVLCHGTSGEAAVIPVDLTTFTADGPVSPSANGSRATFAESPGLGRVTLGSDLVLPGDAVSLSFDYRLDVPNRSNEDFLSFFLGDLALPVFSDGGTGPQIFSGTHTASAVGVAGTAAPVLFLFSFGFGDFGLDSVLTVSNVAIETVGSPAPASAPGVFWLLLAGGLGLTVTRRRSKWLPDKAMYIQN